MSSIWSRVQKNHWASCCLSKAVNETKQYVIETITEDDTTNVNVCEATAIIKIKGSDVRNKLDTGAKVKCQLSCMVMEDMIFQLLA